MHILYSISTNTPLGEFHIIIDSHNIARASGFGELRALTTRIPPKLQGTVVAPVSNHPYAELVARYFAGDAAALNAIPRDQEGSAFQKRIWDAMSDIPYGHTVSYKQLAALAGNPTAIRAAGTSCGLNRLILLVPCHRILKSDGGIGNYVYGRHIKAALLQHEAATRTDSP